MFELYTDQVLTFPDGSSKTREELAGTPYEILTKVPSVIDVSLGITTAYYPLGPIAETYGIEQNDDPNVMVSELNAARSAEVSNAVIKNTSYSSLLSAAKMVALTFTDAQAIEVPNLYPEFELNHEYKQNDRFQYGGTLYKVNQAHTSQAQWVPGETGTESLYTNLMLNDAGYQIWKQPTGAHDAYNTGDIVEYKGTLYKSLINGNVWAPDVYPAGWQEYDESTSTEPGTPEPSTPDPGTETYPDFVQPTGAHDAYKKGDIVRYNGKLYKSLIDGNAYSPDAYPQGWEVYTEE